MHLKPYHFIFAISFSLLLSCGGESPFKPKDAKINLFVQNSNGVKDTSSVTDTVEKTTHVGMTSYLPNYINSVIVTIVKIAGDTDKVITFSNISAWPDTQWIDVVFHSIGARTVTAVVSIQGEADKPFQASIVIVGKPIGIAVGPVSDTVDENSPAVFRVKANGSGPLTFQWLKDNVPLAGATKDSLNISAALLENAGRYACVIKDQWGDSVTSASVFLSVKQNPVVNHKPHLSVTGGLNITSGQTCQLKLSATDTDTGQTFVFKVVKGPTGGSLADTIYQWTPPTGFIGSDTTVFSATDNGTPPFADSVTIVIIVSPNPTKADFTPSTLTGEYPLTVAFTNNSVNATSYYWDFGDGKTSTDKNPINTFTAPGNFSVKLLATGNSVDSMKKTIAATRPPAPTGLAADSGVTWIWLSWTKPSGSVSDTVYYAEGDTVTVAGGSKISNAVSPCVIRNLKVGQKYSISVRSATVRGGVSDFGTVIRKFTAAPRGMKKILAQTKSFSMGQSGIAEPVHSVTFTHNFWMDSTEVTQKDYVSLMTATYPGFSATAPNPLPTSGDNYPEFAITWCDAILFCNARSKRDGLDTIYRYSAINGIPGNSCSLGNIIYDSLKANGYHLPTEAQWEFACRGGTTTIYYWGNDTSLASQYEWYFPLVHEYDTSVALKKPNGFGLYDMLGNAMEYVNDYYDSTYSMWQPVDPLGPPPQSINVSIVCRGGNTFFGPYPCAKRKFAPFEYPWDYGACGFRVSYTENK